MNISRLGPQLKTVFATCMGLFCLAMLLFTPYPAKAAQPSPIASPTKPDFQKYVDGEFLRLARIIDALTSDIMPPISQDYMERPDTQTTPTPQTPPDIKPSAVHAKEAEVLYARALQHLKGQGVPKDAAKAVGYLRQAADMGYAQAQDLLGFCYAQGQGMPKDEHEAVKWFKKAAEQGLAQAQHNLGGCYALGQGVPQDNREAVKWLRKAAEQGLAEAQNNIGLYYYMGLGVPQDHREAVGWFRKAAGQGLVEAQYNLAQCYYQGQGVPQDYREAVFWSRKAAEQGDTGAQFNLGVRYYNGQGVPKDDREAVKWSRKAAEQGHVKALGLMALANIDGIGTSQNTVLAHAFLLLYKASGGDNKDFIALSTQLENTLTPAQKAEAQKQARLMWDKIQAQKAE